MKKSPCGKGYTTCLCFLIECPNYLNQFCTFLIAALSCKEEFFLNTEIFYKISENYWWGICPTCPTSSNAPVIKAPKVLSSSNFRSVTLRTAWTQSSRSYWLKVLLQTTCSRNYRLGECNFWSSCFLWSSQIGGDVKKCS